MGRRLLPALLAVLAACGGGGGGAGSGTGFRVALVTPGSIADAAWNAGAYAGLGQVRDSLGAAVSHVEARTPAEQEEALRTYAAEGYALVFGHGFEFQGAAERVAADHPGTVFIITSGERVRGSVAPLVFRLHEASYLAGLAAGRLTRTGVVGFVGGIELPPIKDAYEAWAAGAAATRPGVDSRFTYLNNFDDAAAGREAAHALMRQGADVLHHNADAAALGVFQAVRETPGTWIFGANADQRGLVPGRVVASAVIDLPRAILAVAREVREGRFTPKVESFGLASGVIRFDADPAAREALPDSAWALIERARDSIMASDGQAGGGGVDSSAAAGASGGAGASGAAGSPGA
ncbi:MAG TPA: BMP family protein [Gemmatimonadales bacterium]|nr:BMP family protein [Gemmatimonadales bacterium]